jgi:uncharacterized protein YdaU (DUF1376 family)
MKGGGMAQAPIMPIFTDALIGDTTHLSTEQFGAYVLILLATWRNNGKALPDDETRMARICRSSVTCFRRRIRPVLCELFFINESGWHQLRLEKEWIRVEQMLKQKRTSGGTGGRSKRLSICLSKTEATHTHTIEESSSAVPVAARAPVPAVLPVAPHDTENVAIATPGNGTWKQVMDAISQQIPEPRRNGHDPG